MMLRTALLLQLWSICSVSAFQDTSPLFYFSTTDTHGTPHDVRQVFRSQELLPWLKPRLSACSSDTYILVSQPGVNAVDYSVTSAAPHLRRRMVEGENGRSMKASFEVSDVIGDLDVDAAEVYLHEQCKAEIMKVDASTGRFQWVDDMKPRVVRVEFPRLPLGQPRRKTQLQEHDSFLSSIIDLLPSRRYTVLYTTTSVSEHDHDVDPSHEPGPLFPPHPSAINENELKRRMLSRREDDENKDKDKSGDDDDEDKQPDVTLVDGPLFQRYQFLTPGLFMTLVVSLLLLGILGVGFRALASLQVSYGAFEKEMGPQGQQGKKQQ